MFEFRTLEQSPHSFIARKCAKVAFVFIHIVILILFILFFAPSLITFTIANSVFPFFLVMSAKAIQWQESARFNVYIERFLNRIILSMKSGSSFRKSYRDSVTHFDQKHQRLLIEIYDFVCFTPQSATDISLPRHNFGETFAQIVTLFQKSQNNQSHMLSMLESFRDLLALKREFRHKSGQITLQLRIQALIVSVGYIGLLSYLIVSEKAKQHSTLVFASSMMFLIGVILIFILGKKKTWKL